MLFTGKPAFLFFLALRCSLIFIKWMIIPCSNFPSPPRLCPLKTLWELSVELFCKTNTFLFPFPSNYIYYYHYIYYYYYYIYYYIVHFDKHHLGLDLFTKLNLQWWDKLKILRQNNKKKHFMCWGLVDFWPVWPSSFPFALLMSVPRSLCWPPLGIKTNRSYSHNSLSVSIIKNP